METPQNLGNGMQTMASSRLHPQSHERYLRWIGGLQLVKGVITMVLAVALLRLLHKDLDQVVGNWISEIGWNLQNPRIAAFLGWLDEVTDRQIGEWSIVTFCLAGMFLTEGTGLLMRWGWAKYFTIVATAAFVPLEVYKTFAQFGPLKLTLLIGNVAVVWVLIAMLRREKRMLSGKSASVLV